MQEVEWSNKLPYLLIDTEGGGGGMAGNYLAADLVLRGAVWRAQSDRRVHRLNGDVLHLLRGFQRPGYILMLVKISKTTINIYRYFKKAAPDLVIIFSWLFGVEKSNFTWPEKADCLHELNRFIFFPNPSTPPPSLPRPPPYSRKNIGAGN